MIITYQMKNEDKKTIDLECNATALKLLNKIGLTPDEVIIIRENSPIPIDEILIDKDVIKIFIVASGG